MRDPSRIRPFLDRLAAVWERVPDQRFGQLMCNTIGFTGRDPFFVEDEEMISSIEEAVSLFAPGEVVNNHIEDSLRDQPDESGIQKGNGNEQ